MPTKLEQIARKAALEAAKVQLRYFQKSFEIHHKGAVDLLTTADIESQKKIVGIISKAFPDHAILAEEDKMGHDRSLEGPIWVIDPLDGTTNFAHGFPLFAVSIAFRNKNRTEMGLIYIPVLKEMFIAHRGEGAFLNRKKIAVSKAEELSLSLLSTGFPYDRRTSKNNNLDLFCSFELASQCVRRAGAATIDLAFVACGRFDGFWEPKLSPWDVAAGSLIVEEAGGRVTNYKGDPFKDLWCGEIVASNGKIHSSMVDIIRVRTSS